MLNPNLRILNNLNGPELIKVLQEKLGDAMQRTGEFGLGLAFPWVKYEIELKMTVYPKQDFLEPPQSVAKVAGDVAEGDPETGTTIAEPPPADAKLETVVVAVGVIDTPDKERKDSGLPIPTTVEGPGGQKIDKPVPVALPKKVK